MALSSGDSDCMCTSVVSDFAGVTVVVVAEDEGDMRSLRSELRRSRIILPVPRRAVFLSEPFLLRTLDREDRSFERSTVSSPCCSCDPSSSMRFVGALRVGSFAEGLKKDNVPNKPPETLRLCLLSSPFSSGSAPDFFKKCCCCDCCGWEDPDPWS